MSRKPRRSWTIDQKQAIAAEVRRRTGAGEAFSHVAKSLEIHETTLRPWLERFGGTAAGVKPVEVIDDDLPADSATTPSISVATPDGFLLDGLDLASAIRLWERIR